MIEEHTGHKQGDTPVSVGSEPAVLTVEQALSSRRSTRAYLPRSVSRAQVESLIALAALSASNSNTQPWSVHVVTGTAKARLTAEMVKAHDNGGRVHTREYEYQPSPEDWPEPFASRRRSFGEGLYKHALGLDETDLDGRLAHHRRNYDFFGAPVGIVLTVAKGPRYGALVDAGLFLQALMLAARSVGLDSCPQASLIDFYPVIREQLSIPEDHLIVCGLALGYADHKHRLAGHRTTREHVDSFVTFHGEFHENTVSATADPAVPGRSPLPDRGPHAASCGSSPLPTP